ncbi:hypothetical protein STEG23_007895, partial [Scotinomys teguina]
MLVLRISQDLWSGAQELGLLKQGHKGGSPPCPYLFWTSGPQNCLKLPDLHHLDEVADWAECALSYKSRFLDHRGSIDHRQKLLKPGPNVLVSRVCPSQLTQVEYLFLSEQRHL